MKFLEPLLKTFPLLLAAIVDHYTAAFPLPSSDSDEGEEAETQQAAAVALAPVKKASKSKSMVHTTDHGNGRANHKGPKKGFSLLPEVLPDTPADLACPYCHHPATVGRARPTASDATVSSTTEDEPEEEEERLMTA